MKLVSLDLANVPNPAHGMRSHSRYAEAIDSFLASGELCRELVAESGEKIQTIALSMRSSCIRKNRDAFVTRRGVRAFIIRKAG